MTGISWSDCFIVYLSREFWVYCTVSCMMTLITEDFWEFPLNIKENKLVKLLPAFILPPAVGERNLLVQVFLRGRECSKVTDDETEMIIYIV